MSEPTAPAVSPPVVAAASPSLTYTRKVLIAVGISVAALLLTAFVFYAAEILVLLFAGILFSVFLSAPSDLLATYARIPRAYALGVVLLVLLSLVVGGSYFMGYTIYRQTQELTRTVPGALEQFEDRVPLLLSRWSPESTSQPAGTRRGTTASTLPAGSRPAVEVDSWFSSRLREVRGAATDFFLSENFVRRAGGIVSSTFGIIGNIAVVLGVGLFFAMSPRTYSAGVIALFPPARRLRIGTVLSTIGRQLQWWFVGQLLSMLSIGMLTMLGLAILGVPMAVTLGILAGLLNFIPNFGPIIAAVPAVLVAFAPQGDQTGLNPALAGYTILLYITIQLLEGWVITPFFQKRAVELPPALIVISQVVFALLLGPIGLVLATPMLAATLVIVRMVYIEDILGDRPVSPVVPAG